MENILFVFSRNLQSNDGGRRPRMLEDRQKVVSAVRGQMKHGIANSSKSSSRGGIVKEEQGRRIFLLWTRLCAKHYMHITPFNLNNFMP